MLIAVFREFGTRLDGSVFPNYHYLFLMVLSLQWFSHLDLMDGVRARRQKSGSAVGRIIDEANDMIMQGIYSIWVAYLVQIDNSIIEVSFIMINVIQYTMEIKFIMFENLTIQVGEIGPFEIELIVTSVLLSPFCVGIDFY